MPLDRAHITAASRVMLPAYVVTFTIIGLSFVLTPADRLLASPALTFAAHVAPLAAWGGMFLVAAALMVAALIARSRNMFRFALWICVLCMGVWSAVLLFAAAFSQTSLSAWVWPAFIATACFASERSLLSREV